VGASELPVPVPEIIDAFVHVQLPGEESIPVPRAALRDPESLAQWPGTGMVDYLFSRDPARQARENTSRSLDLSLAEFDTHGIRRGLVVVSHDPDEAVLEELAAHADRLFVALRADPHEGMVAVRRIDALCRAYPMIRAVSLSPHQLYPHIAPNSKEYYPIYTKCAELDIAVYINVGFPGPRVPAFTQDPMALDEVCWFFPELRVIMRHGGEPWTDVCAKMLLRWPNLYYATTAFAPRYYPREIIELCNKRAPNKVIWAGYWPILSYERLFAEMAGLPLVAQAWPRFLAGNAIEAFRLPAGQP
jgi:predicted TIM-barrel fold metal-dependent hydrolase